MLNESHDFVIQSGDFRVYNQYGTSGIDVLREASSLGATMDSQEHYDRRCFPGTREQYTIDLTIWFFITANLPVYWMRGPAGVGKSAIAQTCAENLRRAGYLGATFFFTVKNNDNPLRLFTTIAYQLAALLPDYRALIDDKISKDKSIVGKKMSSQFELLISEPFKELERQGKSVGRRAIFIDGLDECADKGSQVEIIEIITSSVEARTTPFFWAIFSREEPHIVSAFNTPIISLHYHSVLLPISREADRDVELYLRGGFENILKRRSFLHLSSSWPTAEQIKKLVDAAAGLFAHPAAVLRFIDQNSYSGFMDTLEAVLKSIVKPNTQTISPYAELDGLYMLILRNVPDDVLPSMSLLLASMATEIWPIGIICNQIGISETAFRSIYHHLQAVVRFKPPSPYPLDEATADLKCSYYDQGSSFNPSPQLRDWVINVHGDISFYHKSFYDFLIDPTRSLTFCVTTPAMYERIFDCRIQQHHYFASTYVIQGSKLVSVAGVGSSSASLSWPHGMEFVDSFLKLGTFVDTSIHLSHDHPKFGDFLKNLSSNSLQKLMELDYRKYLLSDIMICGNLGLTRVVVAGHPGFIRTLPHTMFQCLQLDEFDAFQPTAFLAMVEKLEKLQIIRPYHPQFRSSPVASLLHSFSRYSQQTPSGRSRGHYKLGRGDRSVVWYWELDTEKPYFHDFRTVNYAEAMKTYKTEQFKMWEESW